MEEIDHRSFAGKMLDWLTQVKYFTKTNGGR